MAFVLFNEEAKIGRDSHRSTSLISVGSSTCGPNNQQSREKKTKSPKSATGKESKQPERN